MNVRQQITEKQIAVMQAFVDGAEIESRSVTIMGASWNVAENPSWAWTAFEYRVKEDMEKKAWRMLWEGYAGSAHMYTSVTEDARRTTTMRKLIDAVKSGDIY